MSSDIRDKLNKAMGTDLFRSLGEGDAEAVVNGLSSGSLALNMALSGNPFVGYQWGRIVEIYGGESVGKSTLALYALLEAQKLDDISGGVPAAYIDAEHAMDTRYVRAIGIDLSRIHLAQPDCGEQALDAAEKAVELGYKLIIVDSVAALTPRAEIEGEMGASHVGLQARLMSQALRKLQSKVQKASAIIIFINQIRMKVGVIYGSNETTSGGRALKFYASYRLEMRSPRGGAKTRKTLSEVGSEENQEYGITANVKVVKNKVYPPYRRANFFIEYGKGIDTVRDAVDFMEYAGAFADKKLELAGKEYSKSGLQKALNMGNTELGTVVTEWIRGLEGKA